MSGRCSRPGPDINRGSRDSYGRSNDRIVGVSVFVQTFDLFRLHHHRDMTPAKADIGVMTFGLSEFGRFLNERKCLARKHPTMVRALNYLRREQEPDGAWFGRLAEEALQRLRARIGFVLAPSKNQAVRAVGSENRLQSTGSHPACSSRRAISV